MVAQLDFPSMDQLCGKKSAAKVSETQGNNKYLQSDRQKEHIYIQTVE